MNISLKDADKNATRFKIGEDDLVTVDGRKTRCIGLWEEGVVLRPLTPRDAKPLAVKHAFLTNMLLCGRLEVDRDHFGTEAAIKLARNACAVELPPEIVLRARMLLEFIEQECTDDNFAERAHRSDKDIKRFYAVFKAENVALVEEASQSLAAKGKTKPFVGPRQFRRLLVRFEAGSLHPTALLDRRAGRSGSRSDFTHDELEFHLKYADEYRTLQQTTIKQCFINMTDANNVRIAKGEPGLRIRSLTTFQRLVKEGNDFANEALRSENTERVLRKVDMKRRGLQPLRPLEILEMDEHEFDARVLLTKNKLWDYLDPAAQVRIEALGRLTMSVALDAYSRSVCGMKIAKVGNTAELAIATLAMVAKPKHRIAQLAGSSSGWPQCGTPEGVHTDAGAGYTSSKFELAVMLFTGNHRIPPSKHPHLRGRVERFFRIINQRYTHLFPGRTFSNPLLRDEYDSDRYARLTDEEVADLLVRLIVDCYHNTKHRSLGMTPLESWERGSQLAKGPIEPPPAAKKYREIFGSTVTATIGRAGIRIFGNNYSSPKLREIQKKWFGSTVLVRLNEEDISEISVKHKFLNQWVHVPAANKGLVGATLEEWKDTVRAIHMDIGHQEEYSAKIVLETLRAVREVIDNTKQRPGAILHEDPAERLRKFDADIGSFKWDQYSEADYGHRHNTSEDDDDNGSVIEFTDDYAHEFFGEESNEADEQSVTPKRGGKSVVDHQWVARAGGVTVPDAQEYDTSHFISAEQRLLPPDQRNEQGGSSPKRRKTKVPAPTLPEEVYRVSTAPPEPDPGRSSENQAKPSSGSYGFKTRRSKEQDQ